MTRFEEAVKTVEAYYNRVGYECFKYYVEHDSLPSPVSMAYKDLKYAMEMTISKMLSDTDVIILVNIGNL